MRMERAAAALRGADQSPTAAQLVVLLEDVSRTCQHLARAVERWIAHISAPDFPAANGERSIEDLRALGADLARCQLAAVTAHDALLAHTRSG